MSDKAYIAIDLKSFYASAECVSRSLDPLGVNLVVADPSRTEKTICLAVSPSLKAYGIPGRARLFEVVQKVREINALRSARIPDGKFSGKSYYAQELKDDPTLELDFIIAPPRMGYYVKLSSQIYSIYLKYIAPEDIHIYSIDEVFIDITHYISLYRKSPYELANFIMDEIFDETGIRATCGIGTNMYLAKIALDITAKHSPDFIGFLDESTYRQTLWDHKPLTDFWRIGKGTAARLEKYCISTMKQIAACPEELIYRLFGIDGELLIDHAWGRETATIADIKAYTGKTSSISSGQVLPRDYDNAEAVIIIKEMVDSLSLSLVEKGLVTESVWINIGYSSKENLSDSHGTRSLRFGTSASSLLTGAVLDIFSRISEKHAKIRRINISFNNIHPEQNIQYDIFSDIEALEREKRLQTAIISIKHRFGKNSVLKGINFEPSATMRTRNRQIGGHKSGEYEHGQKTD